MFFNRSTKRASIALGRVLGGSRRRAVAQTRLASTKMSRGPSALPFKVPGDKLSAR